ncbi:hypothetical protein [Brevundimonas sp.]|uniref:hypothetical protein n=1 Tax=Brevundimonas sp. TaxID=1871086 RepID=UPI0028AF5AD5|nr:hypothetical protein [Brevundimonas sp.]
MGDLLRCRVVFEPVDPLPVPDRTTFSARTLVSSNRENRMTYIEPDTPDGAPEIQPPSTPEPDLQPGETPEELPPLEPGGGRPGDSRPHD